MAKTHLYEITVERKLREKHTVRARTRTEAAMAFGQPDFESESPVWVETVDEKVLTPKLVDDDSAEADESE